MAKQAHNGDRRRLTGVIVVCVAAVILFSGWMRMRNTVVSVRAEQVTRQNIASVISTNGRVEPINNFEAHAPAPATVKKIFVKEGDKVKAGQLLLLLDDADARAQSAKALAQLRAAEADLNAVESGGSREELLTNKAELSKALAERDDARRNLQAVQQLQRTGAAAPAEVEAAQNRLQKAEADTQLLESKQKGRYSSPEVAKVEANAAQARAAYAAAQDLMKNTNIRAPFAGTVYQIPVKQGSYVPGGELLVQLADLENVQVRAFVDEPEIGRLSKGQRVEVTWDATPGRKWLGVLTGVPTVVTTVGTRTVGEITVKIENGDRKLLPNVNVNVNIISAEHDNTLTVSREAVHELDGKHYVYRIVNKEIRSQEIKTGISSLTRVEVTSGLSDGALIALGAVNAAPLHTGMEVKVVER
jgi:HlyD family secretion protein